jgi:hypothetical protein
MRLEIHQVIGTKEVVEADFEQVRRRSVARDVPAQLGVRPVRAHDHRKRVPAHDGRDPALELQVAGELRLVRERDRILVRRVEHRRQRHAPRARVVEQLAQEKRGALAAFRLDQGVERLEPFPGFGGVGVRGVYPPERRGNDVGEISHPGMVNPSQARENGVMIRRAGCVSSSEFVPTLHRRLFSAALVVAVRPLA